MAVSTISPLEIRTQSTFSALMWALSYPGRPQPLAVAGLALYEAIGEALIDLETSYFSADAELERRLAFTGARKRAPSAARYQFYPELRSADLPRLADAPTGSYAYPDEAATLVVGCAMGHGQTLRLIGPGISDPVDLLIDGIPDAFWALRERAIRYPLGWDLFLVAGDTVYGVPRSTIVEAP